MANEKQPICANHPKKEGTHTCKNCGKKICSDCVSDSFGNNVCEECSPDRPPKRQISKFTKYLITFFIAMFVATLGLLFMLFRDPPHERISIYRVAYYPLKNVEKATSSSLLEDEEKSVARFLEDKGIKAEWKSLENKLTSEGGYFVYFDNPEVAGVRPVWYVKDDVAFTINEDSLNLCNNEISKATVFADKGVKEGEILNYIYGSPKR